MSERPDALGLTAADLQDALAGAIPPGLRATRADVAIDDIATARAVLLGPERAQPSPSAKILREGLAREFDLSLVQRLLRKAENAALSQRRRPSTAAYVLDERDAIVARFVSTAPPESSIESGGALRPHLLIPLKQRRAVWDASNPQTWVPITFKPTTGTVLNAYILAHGGAPFGTLVLLEHVEVRYDVERFGAAFKLSARESEVIALLLEGKMVSEIADDLAVAETTVQYHVKNAMAKAGAHNRMHLAARILGFNPTPRS